jgi:hypothetical protein
MKLKLAMVGTFALNIVLGNICLMPMAAAQSMPDDHQMEEAMTPMEPMSPMHCEGCIEVRESQKAEPMPCGGSCLSQASDTTGALVSTGGSESTAPSGFPAFIAAVRSNVTSPITLTVWPPPLSSDSIVLRL